MALQVFTAGQTLTAAQMTTLQASTYNYPLSTISTSTYTILSSDAGKLLVFTNNASPVGVTFPASLGMAVGDTVEIVHGGTGTLTLIADAGVTLNSEGSLLTLGTRYARVAVVKTASNVFLVSWMTAITEAEITTGSVTSDKIADGTIMNVDINASAAIALSKLATGALPTAITVASANLVDGTIVNADINASAAIAHSKLANATAGQVLLGTTTTGVVTATTISGDVTIDGAGVATIAANSVALGTDTTGNYVTSLVAGTGITLTNGTAAEGGTPTIAVTSNTYQPLDGELTALATVTSAADALPYFTGSGTATTTTLTTAARSILDDSSVGAIRTTLGVGTTDSPTFAGAAIDLVQVGVTSAGEIDTSSGNLTIDSAGGTTTIDDNVTITGNLTVNGSSVTSQNTSQGYATTATSAGTLTLTSTSTYLQYFTGLTTHTVVLPVTSTLQQGTGYEFHNNSTGAITVNSSGGNLVTTVQPAQTVLVTCILVTGTTAASWDADVTGGTSSTGTGALVFATSPTLATPTLGVATATSVNGTTIPSSKTLVVTTDKLSVHAATTSAELAGVISDETGSGALVFANTPTLVTPNIGAATGTSLATTNIRVGVTAAGEIDTSSGNLTIDSAGGTVTVDDNLVVSGDLTVNGTTTTLNTDTLAVEDNIIVLNSNITAAPTLNAGIEVERGTSANVLVRWNETSDKWEATNDGTTYGNIVTTADTGTVSNTMLAGSIAYTKLASATAGQVLLGTTTTGVVTATTLSGDVTVNGAGVTALASNLTLAGNVTGNPAAGTTSTGTSGFGYMGLPQNASTTGSYTILAADAGTHIYSSANRAITIPSSGTTAMPIGTTIVFIAGSGATVTISISSSPTANTLYLAGPGTTGSRTLAPFGMATAVKITATSWIISGNGLT
jgi:hypothetical protein